MKCADAQQALIRGPKTRVRDILSYVHMQNCPICAHASRAIRRQSDLLGSLPEGPLPEGLRSRVLLQLAAEPLPRLSPQMARRDLMWKATVGLAVTAGFTAALLVWPSNRPTSGGGSIAA